MKCVEIYKECSYFNVEMNPESKCIKDSNVGYCIKEKKIVKVSFVEKDKLLLIDQKIFWLDFDKSIYDHQKVQLKQKKTFKFKKFFRHFYIDLVIIIE